MLALKNPGPEAPTILQFDQIPSLFEFLAHGGVPGVEYIYVAAENMPKAQKNGFTQIAGLDFFEIAGVGAALMARGKPLRNTPAQPGTGVCQVFADDKILAAVGGGVPKKVDPPRVDPPKVDPPSAKIRHEATSNTLLTTK
jgi:hypothetical protein